MTSLSGVTRNWGDPPAKIIQKPNGWRIENAQGFNGYWFKHVTSNNARVLYLLASGRQFCCRPCLTGGFRDIWLSQREGYCDVLAQRLAALPRNECETIWSLPPSDRNSPMGSLVTGTPAEAKLRAIKSLRAWCLADLPGALLHTKLWSPRASTSEPLWHWCGVQRSNYYYYVLSDVQGL